jgi:CheY-like chemotaxis protein
MSNNTSPTIVVIDDDPDFLAFVTTFLTRANYRSVGFVDARTVPGYLREHGAALIITDLFMPNMDGFEVLRALRNEFPSIPVIALSGSGQMEREFYLRCAVNLGAVASLNKPFEPEALRTLVTFLLGDPQP